MKFPIQNVLLPILRIIINTTLVFSIAQSAAHDKLPEDWDALPSSLFNDTAPTPPTSSLNSLVSLYEHAKKTSPQLRVQKMALVEQLAIKAQASSRLYPTITLKGNTSNRDYDYRPTDSSPNNTGYYSEQKLELRIQQSLFSYGLHDTVDAYHLNTQIAQEKLEQEETRLIINIAKGVLNTVAGFDNWQHKQAQWQTYKKLFQLTERRFELGETAKMDVQEVQAMFSHAYSQRLQAKNHWSLTQLALRELTNLESLPHWQWKQAPITLPSIPNEKALYRAASNTHKTLHILQWKIAALRKLKTASKNAYYPNVSVSAGYTSSFSKGFQSPLATPAKDRSRHSDVYDIGLYFEWALFSGGKTEAKQQEYQAKLEKAQAELEQWQRNLKTNIRQSLQQVRYTQAQQTAALLAMEASQEARKAMHQGYALGIRSITELLNSEQRTLETQQNYNTARVSLLHAYLQVLQLAGTLSPKDLLFLDQWLVVKHEQSPEDL